MAVATLLATHAGHITALVVPAVAAAVAIGATDLNERRGGVDRSSPGLAGAAALMALVAAGVHAAVCPEHLREAALEGLFFLGAAAGQASWAVVCLMRPASWCWRVGAVANGAVVALWAVSRTVGVPVGAGAGAPEAVGWPDVLATCAEVLCVAFCALMWRRAHRATTTVPGGTGSAGPCHGTAAEAALSA